MGCKVNWETKRIQLHGIGPVKIVLHRPLEGTLKTATIFRTATGKWWVSFSVFVKTKSCCRLLGKKSGLMSA
jgi:hypothetical protein